jgi:RNA polymerase sigma-70 factor (ECF subfamily)
MVQDALQRLGDTHRSVIVMFDIMGLSYEEIAASLGVPLGTVKSRLHYATRLLRASIRPTEPERDSERMPA